MVCFVLDVAEVNEPDEFVLVEEGCVCFFDEEALADGEGAGAEVFGGVVFEGDGCSWRAVDGDAGWFFDEEVSFCCVVENAAVDGCYGFESDG